MSAPLYWADDAESLSEVLAQLGYTHEKRENGGRRILRDGVEVFAGDYCETSDWLVATSQVTR